MCNLKWKKEIILRFTELTELTGRFITRKTIFVCCSQKVVLGGRTTAPLKICLHGQVFVRLETSGLHLACSTGDSNLTDFLVIKTNLSKFCAKCDLCLICIFHTNQSWKILNKIWKRGSV